MRIKLSPQRRDDWLEISKLGKSLIINGEVFDFSPMNDDDLRMLKLWKTYRVALSRVPQQAEYPNNIVWPIQPDTANG